MKIALVSPYDFAYPGGVTNHISCLERYLTLMGHEVKVIAPASKAIASFGDRFIPIGKPRPVPASGSICRVTISIRLSSSIKAVLDAEKFDIIHLHEPLMPMLCTTVLRLSQTANVGTFHAHGARLLGYNFGGNTDFYNMLERERLESKKISKTTAVTSQLDYKLNSDNIHVGPSDYVPWLTDRKFCHIRMEGQTFGDVPLNLELKLEVW
ncbi:unnamed protein product, partial [marine sediment metagenome]